MKILFAGLRHDYGQPSLGSSFEADTFLPPLSCMGDEVVFFDTGRRQAIGRRRMGTQLRECIRNEAPEVMFSFLFRDDLPAADLDWVRERTECKTVNWFADDHWRFESFTRRWTKHFDWSITTDSTAVRKHQLAGQRNVILSQWASNPLIYRPLGLTLAHPVTFVGQAHGDRAAILARLAASGIPIQAFGRGWPGGRLDLQGVVRLFNSSRINLNLAGSSTPAPRRLDERVRARLAYRLPQRWLDSSLAAGVRRILPNPSTARESPPQIKGRNFEVPACGGFLLTPDIPGLSKLYAKGREVACFQDEDGLRDESRYFLDNEAERAEVAQAGLERTLREHTYFHRFHKILSIMGFRPPALADLLIQTSPGLVKPWP